MTYSHRYITPTEYEVWQHFSNGYSRKVDPHNEVEWIAAGNTPAIESGDRFILIIDGVPTLDPNKDAILAAEAAASQAEADRIAAKAQAFLDNLPSWSAVQTAVDNISNLADARVFLKKLARIVYWLARDAED